MSDAGSDPRSERLNQIIADYLKAVESGEAPAGAGLQRAR